MDDDSVVRWLVYFFPVGVLANVCLPALAAAGPGIVVAPHIYARAAPSDDAIVLEVVVEGRPICLVDAANTPPDWQTAEVGGRVVYTRRDQVRAVSLPAGFANICVPEEAERAVAEAQTAPRAYMRKVGLTTAAPGSAAAPITPATFLPLHPIRGWLGLASGAAWLDSTAAARHHIGNVGPTFYLTLGAAIYEVFAVSASFGAVFPADHASFEQDVVPLLGGGDPSTAHSSLEVHNYSIAIGPRTPLLALQRTDTGEWALAAFAEYGWSDITGQRSIDNCSDCRSEDFTLSGGQFVRGGVDVGVVGLGTGHGGLFVTLAYSQYLAPSGISGEMRLGFTINAL